MSREELKGTVRQIKDQQRQLTQLATKAKRVLPGALPEVQVLQKKLGDFVVAFSGKVVTRGQLQDYQQSGLWDEINPLQQKIERFETIVRNMPKEIKSRQRALSTLEKFFKGSQVKSALSSIGINTNALDQEIVEWRGTIEQWNALYQAAVTNPTEETIDAAADARNSAQADAPPQEFEIRGLNQRLRELYTGYARPLLAVKDQEVRVALIGLLSDVVEAVNSADYRGAQEAFTALPPGLRPLFTQARRVTTANKARFLDRIEDLLSQLP